MRILIDARMYGLEHSGVGRYIINLIDELHKSDRRNKYTLLLRKKYFESLKFRKNWTKVLADIKHYSISAQVMLPKIINAQNPDLVHFPHLNIPIFWKGKFVVTLHDMIMHRQGKDATTLPLPIYYLKRIPYKFAFRKAVNNSKKIIVPSIATKKELLDYFEIESEKIALTYEGIDSFLEEGKTVTGLKTLRKYGLSNKKYFFYIGNAYPHKNLERVVEAIKYLNERSKENAIFTIASSKNFFTKRLKRYIDENEASDYVKLIGFIPDSELAVLMKNSVAFVYPSTSEGFGLQGLEAMVAGTLVLASDIPIFKEIYKENAIYFNPFDFSSILKSLKDTLGMEENKRVRLISRSQKFIKRYSWSKMAKQTLKVYESCAGL